MLSLEWALVAAHTHWAAAIGDRLHPSCILFAAWWGGRSDSPVLSPHLNPSLLSHLPSPAGC